MSVTLLFTAHNRLEFTRASFETLVANTSWDLVERLVVLDDASSDGTAEWLAEEISNVGERTGCAWVFRTARFGGPVAAMNHALDLGAGDMLAKIDSDVIVCPGWLQAMVEVLDDYPSLDALGMEPGFGGPLRPASDVHSFTPARHVGGVGVFRTRLFAGRRPRPLDRYFGLTRFWADHAATGWVTPDLPVFLLDHLPFEPWVSLTRGYLAAGWSRAWPTYKREMEPYWSWWARDREGAVA